MNLLSLAIRGAVYHRRTHLGVIGGAAIAAAVLIGGLILGDSVKETLRAQAVARIGGIDTALIATDRFFLDDLPSRLDAASAQPNAAFTPVLLSRGVASTPAGDRVARSAQLLGVTDAFFGFAPRSPAFGARGSAEPDGVGVPPGDVLLAPRLATQLEVTAGDTIIIRVEQPSALPRDAVLGTLEDVSLAIRLRVSAIIDDTRFSRFGLAADQVPPMNAFVDLAWLQEQLEIGERANLILASGIAAGEASAALSEAFIAADAQLRLESPGGMLAQTDPGTSPEVEAEPRTTELTSGRILMNDTEAGALGGIPRDGILTYFVNTLASGERATPYSMVAAIGPLQTGEVSAGSASTSPVAPQPATGTGSITAGLNDDQAYINTWLAEDLDIGAGDPLRIEYFALDENDRLVERQRVFTVAGIVPLEGVAADRSLMPDFPGIAGAESSRDWEPGIPIDLDRIRDNDEDYWDTHRGTPKAFVTLAAGQAMWSSRYGDLTAIRLANSSAEKAAKQLEQRIDPASLGLFFVDIRGPALRATQATTDFGQLFLALSFVLMGSALLLTAMLFAFNIELRSAEIGAQLAVGLPPRTVQGLLLAEGAVIASLGALLGAPFGVLFSAGILALLRSVWADAIASASVSLHIAPATIAIGVTSAVIAAGLAMLVSMRGLLRRGPVALLTGDRPQPRTSSAASGIVLAIGMVFLGGAAAAAFLIDPAGPAAAGAFFGIGSALLIGGLAVAAHAIARLGSPAGSAGLPSIRSLGLRGTARRAARSIATVALVAIGVFLVVAVSVNRIDPLKNADLRASGTGGFALIAESTIPLPVSLDQQRGRDLLGLDEDDTAGASFVHLRVRDGDDASCLNLNLAQNPRLLGVDPESLAGRGAFTFKRFTDETEPSWHALSARAGPVPAIVDDASAQWAMHKGIGDTITYVDGAGEPFEVVIVGTVATSILQGSVIIDAATFRERFPRVQGFAMTLIDAPSDRASDIAATLTRAGSDLGMELTPAARRLGEFSAVQNTYLAIFQVLGGLGLLLGTLGLAAVVLRNVFERRKEFAVLRAVGLSPALVRGLVVIEHVFLLGLGLALGVSVAAVAVVPTLLSATDSPPVALTTALVLGMTLFGWAAVSFAARRATAADVAGTLAREG